MCGKDSCKDMVSENRVLNGNRLNHTDSECQLLSESGLGRDIVDYDRNDIIFACIFILRM